MKLEKKGRQMCITYYNKKEALRINVDKKELVRCGADKSLARPTSRYILFDVENISFDARLSLSLSLSLYIYI